MADMEETDRKQEICVTVAQDKSGHYGSVGEALKALDAMEGNRRRTARILVKKGVYRERLEIKSPWVTLEGEDAGSTVITGGLYARMPMEGGGARGTFRTYTVLVDTHDFTARNLTFENSSGPGEKVGQALALYVDGDRILFEGCRILGGQDTLFTGPLPPKELKKGGFIGPKQYAPRIHGRHCYRNCLIQGDIDFIFGSATAYFEGCELHSRGSGPQSKGYVTAASTPEGQVYGYVFRDCRFTGNCPEESVYLGRPWRDHARTVLVNCYLGPHICREGWHDWGKKEAHETLLYGEYGSFGPGAGNDSGGDAPKAGNDSGGGAPKAGNDSGGHAPKAGSRPDWVSALTCREIQDYTKDKVLGGTDGWSP